MSYMAQDMKTASGKKFHVIVAGTTNGAHRPIVGGFKSKGQTEVTSPEQCDYLLVFCPVASRVGTDISEALDHIPAGKQAVLVVMHHTFNHHHVIAASSRLVQNPNILLTVDCLFHDNKLLNCDLNNKMWHEVYNFLGVSQYSLWRISSRSMVVLLVFVVAVVVVFQKAGYDFYSQTISGYVPQDMQSVIVVLLFIALMVVAAIRKAGYPFLNQMKLRYVPQDVQSVSGKKFHVIVAGTTNGAHRPIVGGFKSKGQTEVTSPEQCDYLLVFCPVASRVGTDISEALDHIPAGKQAVLVVMHHTFNHHCVIAASSRLVQNPNILLTVDCLFHDNKLLNCDLNSRMWHEVYNFLGVSQCFLMRISLRWLKIKLTPVRTVYACFVVSVTCVIWKARHYSFAQQTHPGSSFED
ncbi:uncharacterized protein LOC111575085 [Amphiprion ocellaris]|uniref:uncharacterized protein LOC111575085 n=1 Tax=Amphiprion ocellaris TaxID=80972 RepID=UPI0024115E11|nr:uncharacterized protein LOC111575085 [Amphiprion ocellaris]